MSCLQCDWIFDENSDDEPPPPLPEHERPAVGADHNTMATSFSDMQDLLRLANKTDEGTSLSLSFRAHLAINHLSSSLPFQKPLETRGKTIE